MSPPYVNRALRRAIGIGRIVDDNDLHRTFLHSSFCVLPSAFCVLP